MALTTRAPGQSPIDSSAINQFVQALTGVMSDQPFTLANTLNVTNTFTASSNVAITGTLSVTGTLTSSGFNSSFTITASSNITTSSGFFRSRQGMPSSAAIQALSMGSSGPSIYYGSSIPTIACTVPSMFFNTGGSSTTGIYVCMPNGGTASSSNWDNITGYA